VGSAASPEQAAPKAGLIPPRKPAVVRFRWAILAGALAAGVGIGGAIALLRHSSPAITSGTTPPVETWAAGTRRAPAFVLHDETGKVLSLAALHGRPVIVTFIDPLCRDFCPREASVISAAAKAVAPRSPAIVAISVDPWGDTKQNFRADAAHWRLAPQWRWGIGSAAELSPVWRGYGVGVLVTKKRIAGITVREITHTGAAYLIDASGYERALFLYPFKTSDLVDALRALPT